MSILLAVWHFVPWYTWPLLVVAIVVLLEVPGALAAFVKIARAVPWWVYVGVGGAIAFGVWLQWHDDGIDNAWQAKLEAREAFWQKRERDANDAHEKAVAALQLKLTNALNTARAAAAAHAAQLKAERDKRQAAEAALDQERKRNVTPHADAVCTVTAGVVHQLTLATALANGSGESGDAGAPGTRPLDVDAPSGVAISEISAANDDNAKAFAACRERVGAWESYHATVIKPWIASTVEALQSCIPKGTP